MNNKRFAQKEQLLQSSKGSKVCESRNLLWVKAILYRIVRIIIVFISGYFILGDPTIALSIAGVDMIAATLFYWYFDVVWYRIERTINKIIRKWKYRGLK